jgi:hypothetical protein
LTDANALAYFERGWGQCLNEKSFVSQSQKFSKAMDSVNLASEANSNEATNRIKALAGVAERIGCTLTQVRISTLWLNGRQLTYKVKEYAGEAGLTPGLSRVTK